jgi:dolichyl-phosphate beta-glucosyltransferase
MENKLYLSVIIPAYNEESQISETLIDVDKYLSRQKFSSEIIVVIDGATDKTREKVRNMQNLVKNLKMIDNKENHGKGWVVRQAMLAAEGEYRLFMDADNATTVEHFDKAVPLISEGGNIIIGSRDPKDAKGAKKVQDQSFLKRSLGNFGNILIQIVAVWGIWDTQCGFKIFSAKAAKDIFSKCLINRWGFDIEALALARKLKYKIGIIPIIWYDKGGSLVGKKGLGGYGNTLKELFQIRLNFITGKYRIKK